MGLIHSISPSILNLHFPIKNPYLVKNTDTLTYFSTASATKFDFFSQLSRVLTKTNRRDFIISHIATWHTLYSSTNAYIYRAYIFSEMRERSFDLF